LDPAKATLAGALPVISQEYPHRRCRIVDVGPGIDPVRGSDGKLIETLLAVAVSPGAPAALALRGRQGWEPHVVRWRGADGERQSASPVFRDGGVYLITSGLEEVGVEQAEFLAAAHGARLALQVAADFPAESDWDAHLEARPSHRTSTQIRDARRLQDLAGGVLLLPADPSDVSATAALPGRAAAHFGALDGFIHNGRLTGERAFRTVADTDVESCGWQLDPKVHGLRHLASALLEHDLDFCVLNSSMSSLLGGLGTYAYAAANAYLDAFAHERARLGEGRFMAINWEAWKRTEIAGLSPDLAAFALDGGEGADVLGRLLRGDAPARMVVSAVDFEHRRHVWAARGHFAAERPPEVAEQAGARGARPDLETLYEPPATDTERLVAEVWQRVLGLERVGVLDNFFELGGDSLVAVQTASQLEKVVGRRIPVVDLYDGLTVRSLAVAVDGLKASDAPKSTDTPSPDADRRDRRTRGRESQQQQRARRLARRR
ncbi:MAG: KR domain-containing protein, partial [Acidobacteriota bacterium]